ncbi:Cell division coordinator CpoB [subsurface metagenome]
MCKKMIFVVSFVLVLGLSGNVSADLTSQRDIVVSHIANNNQAQANGALGQLLAEFAGHERLPHTVHKIAEQCHESGTADRAKHLFQNALPEQAKSPQVIWLQMGLAISNILLENGNAAWTSIEHLLYDFSADDRCAEAVGQVAWCYRKLEEHENARTLYRHVVDNWPDKPRAIFSQRGIVFISLSVGNVTEAEAATEKLLSRFSQDEHLPKVVSTIAEKYQGLEEYEKAIELHQYVLDNHPDSDQAIFSQSGVIISSIELGDDSRAEAGIDELLSQFSSNEHIAKVAYQVARKLNKKDDTKAQELYEYVIDNLPSDEHAALARVNIGQIQLRLSNDAAARSIFDGVLSDFSGHSILPIAVSLMAEGYWDQAWSERMQGLDIKADDHFTKSLDEWEIVITQFAEIPFTTAQAYHFAGDCYRHFKVYEKAIEYYQTVADNWPDYKSAWYTQFMVGQTYKQLKLAGDIPVSKAESEIESAFRQLLRDYPDCQATGAARTWLNYYNNKKNRQRERGPR